MRTLSHFVNTFLDQRTAESRHPRCRRYASPFRTPADAHEKMGFHVDDYFFSYLAGRAESSFYLKDFVLKVFLLQIVKPPRMIAVGKWAGAQTRGYAFLALLGDEEQPRRILGTDYTWVTGTIAGTAIPPALPLVNTTKRLSGGDSVPSGQTKKPRLS